MKPIFLLRLAFDIDGTLPVPICAPRETGVKMTVYENCLPVGHYTQLNEGVSYMLSMSLECLHCHMEDARVII